MSKPRTLLVSAAAVATILALSACSGGGMGGMDMGSDSSSSDVSENANTADITFAQMMIPHHEQAVKMSEVVLAKADIDQRVKVLAEQIKNAQEPEIMLLQDWLAGWDAVESMSEMDHDMDGMMSEGDMEALESASGVEASKLFLESMIAHHNGAIMMAQSELDDGKNVDAKALAENIISTQRDEVTTMQDLLNTL